MDTTLQCGIHRQPLRNTTITMEHASIANRKASPGLEMAAGNEPGVLFRSLISSARPRRLEVLRLRPHPHWRALRWAAVSLRREDGKKKAECLLRSPAAVKR